MNNAMPVLSSEATLLTVDVIMHKHAYYADVIITRDGLMVSIHTIAHDETMFELVSLVNEYRCVNERVKYCIHRNVTTKH